MDREICDILILGTGPAGLQAAIHASRRKVSVIVLGRYEKSSVFGAHIENYCCITGVSGQTLLKEGRAQAEKSGTRFVDEDAVEIGMDDGGFLCKSEAGRQIRASALVFAMGISRKKLGVPGEKKFLGKGVSYCVDCDANFYRGEKVVVVGSESAAVSGALTLLFYADEVHIVCEKLQVAESMAKELRSSAINVHEGRKVKEISGRETVGGLILDDGSVLDAAGVFIELGAKGAIELAANLGIQLDQESMQFIVADKKQATNVKGIYAAGDICGLPWQLAKAVGEGCVAGLEAASYVKGLRKDKDDKRPA
jgi:thioredoxin reductase (NADPH)